MHAPQHPSSEGSRLAELAALGLLDTDEEERFDRITRLAQRLFDVPIALVTLVDEHRQWFKSRQGLAVAETPRDVSFCGHAILDDAVFHVVDATEDARFHDNPLVVEDPAIRFYAGHPIKGPGGFRVGTICVIDRVPKQMSDLDRLLLGDLAHVIEQEIGAEYLATVDHLTGLANRRGFELVAEKVLEICRRTATPATLLYADLDGLKRTNDELGHEAGDRMIVSFAQILSDTYRSSDVIARLGGDEFVVMLTGGSGDAPVTHLEERLREQKASAPTSRVGASIGAVTFDPSGGETLEQLLARADAAMYRSKQRV